MRASTTVAYRPCTALTHHILWLFSALCAKCAILIHYATVVLAARPFAVTHNGACFLLRSNAAGGFPMLVIPAALLLRSYLPLYHRPHPLRVTEICNRSCWAMD